MIYLIRLSLSYFINKILMFSINTYIENSFVLEPLVLEDSSQFFLPEHPGEPQFAEGVETNVNVTGQLGGSVFLHCPVVNSGDRAVSYPSVSTSIFTWHVQNKPIFLPYSIFLFFIFRNLYFDNASFS